MILSLIENLGFTCNAVLPIIILICVGYFLKRIKLFPDGFWKQANKLCFRVALPVLLCMNIYNVEDITAIGTYWKIVLYAVIAILIVFGLALAAVIIFVKDPKQKGVLLQCAFRSNYAIIGISLAEQLSNGNQAVAGIASVVSAVSIPLFNILAIISLSIFIKDDNTKVSIKSILLKIVKNPLIIGVFSGIVLLVIRQLIPSYEITTNVIKEIEGVPTIVEQVTAVKYFSIKNNIPFMYTALNNIAKIASPLALIALGGDFTFAAIGRLKKQIIIGTAIRVVLVPALCLIVAYLVGFRGTEFPSLIALFGTPVAVSSVPMAMEMNNDDELAGQLVVWTSIASALSLFIIILICASIGIFAV